MVDSYCDTTTQKMGKRGFRGERKRILTPALSQGEGNVAIVKGELGNEKISKLERDSGRVVGQGRGCELI